MAVEKQKRVGKSGGASAKAPRGKSTDVRAANYAADILRRRILAGELSPGQRLIEAGIIEELGVGRSTVREAFLRLDSEGFVELHHQRGAVVRRLTRRDLADLFGVRERLEGYAAFLAAQHSGEPEHRRTLSEQREQWKQQVFAANVLHHVQENAVLHRSIFTISGNRRLEQMYEPLELPGYRLQYMQLLGPEELTASAADHVAILDAILGGDAARAERLMRAHVREAGRRALLIPGLQD